MVDYVYLLERLKYIWRNNDWVANQMSSAWSTEVYKDFTIARASAKRDYYYMFSNDPDCIRFEKTKDVEELEQESVVGRITYTYKCCGETYKIIYRVTKKVLI